MSIAAFRRALQIAPDNSDTLYKLGNLLLREGDGAFRILGRGVELLFERHDLSNQEALAYLEQRLVEIGVIAALSRAGFEPGDDLRVGEHEFELHI